MDWWAVVNHWFVKTVEGERFGKKKEDWGKGMWLDPLE